MITTHGDNGLKEQDGAQIVTDDKGLSTGSMSWTCATDTAMSRAPKIGSVHPYASYLYMTKRTITLSKGVATIVGEYAGLEPNLGDQSGPVYELHIGVGEEPIQTHPDFVTKIGGKPSNPLNGARFIDPTTGDITKDDKLGVFDRFVAIVNGERNPFAPIESYLDASEITFREQYTSRARPSSLNGVGEIGTPPGAAPNPSRGRNWLYIGLTYSQHGRVFSVTREWRLSARGGWNQTIYGG